MKTTIDYKKLWKIFWSEANDSIHAIADDEESEASGLLFLPGTSLRSCGRSEVSCTSHPIHDSHRRYALAKVLRPEAGEIPGSPWHSRSVHHWHRWPPPHRTNVDVWHRNEKSDRPSPLSRAASGLFHASKGLAAANSLGFSWDMKLSKEPQCQNVSKKFKWSVPTAHRHVVNSSPTPWCPTCHASWRRAAAAANATWRNAAEPLIATAAADSAAEPCRIQGMPSGNVLHLLLNMAIEVVDLP